MKFRIVQSEQQGEKAEPIVKLRLEYDGNDVDLVAVTEDNEECHILSILPDGRLHRYSSIPKNNGFMVNKNGQIIERK